MSWIKETFKVLIISICTIVFIDISAIFFFKSDLQMFMPHYGNNTETFSRGYPINHFKQDDLLGFDINPNYKTKTYRKPINEYKEYDVWGNSFGCYDDEWKKDSLVNGVYLAGDSFTWAYVEYKKKFGTLLEDKLGTKVYSCGVTHTGQAHQFYKFIKLFNKGIKPNIVIVNIVSNDLDNDFLFPHTEIIDGLMIDNYEICGKSLLHENSSYRKIERSELEELIKMKLNRNFSFKSFLKKYSISANVFASITRSLRIKYLPKTESYCNISTFAGLENIGDKYISSNYTSVNRNIIKKWIVHSEKNNYQLIFSFISGMEKKETHYPFIKKYIDSLKGQHYSFNDYCNEVCREVKKIYYKYDGHFNEKGNQLYAEYLLGIIKQYQ